MTQKTRPLSAEVIQRLKSFQGSQAVFRETGLIAPVVVVEVKCIEAVHPVHLAQLLSYMRLSRIGVGLLINFYVAHLRDGIKRMVDSKDWEK